MKKDNLKRVLSGITALTMVAGNGFVPGVRFAVDSVQKVFADDVDESEVGGDSENDGNEEQNNGDLTEGRTEEGLLYLADDTKVVITGYDGESDEVTIPKMIDDKPVTELTTYAFEYDFWKGSPEIKKVVIEAEITEIPEYCFYSSKLESITFPETLKKISTGAFCGSSLKGELVIPDGVEEIGNSAFFTCQIEKLVIPESLHSIAGAFGNCFRLKSVELSDGITDISGAFSGCTALESINVPDTVTMMSMAFDECKSLKEVNIPDGVINIDCAFRDCYLLEKIDLPDSVESMKYGTFKNCKSLRSVIIPDKVTEIDESTFKDCELLSAVYIPDTVTSIADDAFEGCLMLTIYGEDNSEAHEFAYKNNISFSTGEIEVSEIIKGEEDGFTYIKSGSNLIIKSYTGSNVNLTIPKTINGTKVTGLSEKMFYGNDFVKSLVVECDIDRIPDYCFFYCQELV